MTTRLGPYVLVGELGRGGMGAVFLGRHERTGAERAIKVLEGQNDLEAAERFRREAEALARAGSAGAQVVAIHETGQDAGRLWFAMDYMPRGSLLARLAASGRLPWREAVTLVAKLARSLERCAALGLVHRDVKPANVLFDDQGEPRLSDFGCVRDLSAHALTQTGTSLGTPAYMAPEQLVGDKVGPAADVFALGCVLHELVTGSRPHAGATPFALLAEIRGRRAPPPSALAPCPRDLDAVVARALEPDPGSRYPEAGALARELEALLASGETGPREGLAGVTGLAVAALTLLGLGAVSAAFSRGREPPGPLPAPSPSATAVVASRTSPRPASPTPSPLLSAQDHDRLSFGNVAHLATSVATLVAAWPPARREEGLALLEPIVLARIDSEAARLRKEIEPTAVAPCSPEQLGQSLALVFAFGVLRERHPAVPAPAALTTLVDLIVSRQLVRMGPDVSLAELETILVTLELGNRETLMGYAVDRIVRLEIPEAGSRSDRLSVARRLLAKAPTSTTALTGVGLTCFFAWDEHQEDRSLLVEARTALEKARAGWTAETKGSLRFWGAVYLAKAQELMGDREDALATAANGAQEVAPGTGWTVFESQVRLELGLGRIEDAKATLRRAAAFLGEGSRTPREKTRREEFVRELEELERTGRLEAYWAQPVTPR